MKRGNATGLPEPEEIENLRGFGKNGDTQLAHVNPVEANILKTLGGVGTINPRTGLPQYYESGSGPGGDDRSGDNARDTAGPSQNDSVGGGQGGNTSQNQTQSFFDRLIDGLVPSKATFTDPLATFDKTMQTPSVPGTSSPAGPALAGIVGGSLFGGLAAGAQAINDSYFGGQARADVDQSVGGGSDSNNDGYGNRAGNPSSGTGYYGNGASSPFSFGPVSDWRYQSNNPSAPTEGRLQYLTALNRVTDPGWRKEKIGFGTGDEFLDSIFEPLQNSAMDYLGRAQSRGMLDAPSYNAALEVLRQQGESGRSTLRTQLNEQGDSIIQPLRDRAAELQGQIYGGQYDTTPFSDEFFDQLFEGAIGDVQARGNEFSTDYDPFSGPTALYAGLEQGGNIQGTPLVSTLRSRNRNAPTAPGRGVGSRGIF